MSTVTALPLRPRDAADELVAYLRSHSGLEFLETVRDGYLPPPPIGRTLGGIEPVEFSL